MTLIIYRLLLNGGFQSGGFNFDTKVRRQSIDPVDMFYGHIGGIDVLAKSLMIAQNMVNESLIKGLVDDRYSKWSQNLGSSIMRSEMSLSELSVLVESGQLDAVNVESGKQERMENIVTKYVHN